MVANSHHFEDSAYFMYMSSVKSPAVFPVRIVRGEPLVGALMFDPKAHIRFLLQHVMNRLDFVLLCLYLHSFYVYTLNSSMS